MLGRVFYQALNNLKALDNMTQVKTSKSEAACVYGTVETCAHPSVLKIKAGDHIMISKVISTGTILTLLVLFINAVVSWTTMYVNQQNTIKAVEANSRSIADSKREFSEILTELRVVMKESRAEALESSKNVEKRVDRLLELELQSRRH